MSVKNIIHVDDHVDILLLAKLALERLGVFSVRTCTSGAEALQTTIDFPPDLILLDVMMPEMNGPETLRALRARKATRTTPVIFVTATLGAEDRAYYKRLGSIGVVAKPLDHRTFATTIAALYSGNWSQLKPAA